MTGFIIKNLNNMNRRNILKGLGVLGAGSLIPFHKAEATGSDTGTAGLMAGDCVLIPQETAGPYPLDLSKNSSMFRQDVTEENSGTPLELTMTIVNVNNDCAPIPNARVDIWHCNKDGYYSGFSNQPGYLGTKSYVGETFFRGIQLTDNNGEVHFTTIYPGWYPGRVTHIHFQVFLNSILSATSQMAFPETLNTTVYNTALYSAHGQNPTKNTNDNVFSDSANTQYQIVTIEGNDSGGYDASLTVGISAPTTGIINLEPETGGQFKLHTNYPNPFSSETTISFSLTATSRVTIELFDLQGRKVAHVVSRTMEAGEQNVLLKREVGGIMLSEGSYVYQLTVENSNGSFRQCKLLTVY
jgi:protocatechuate 3,4-dioxygenase beta subunit